MVLDALTQQQAESFDRDTAARYAFLGEQERMTPRGRREFPGGSSMNEPTVAIHMPHLLYQRLQRLAELTHRPLESLVLQAVDAHIPPLLEDMPEHIRQDLAALEKLDDAALRHVAQSAWSRNKAHGIPPLWKRSAPARSRQQSKDTLEELYQEANCHMLRKAYANALLKWRGHQLPTLAELEATR